MSSTVYNNSIHTSSPGVAGGWSTASKSGHLGPSTGKGQTQCDSYTHQMLGNQSVGNSPMTVQSERIVNSNIVGETLLGYIPQEENVQYIEVPMIEEVVRHVPKKEYVEVERRVPRYEYEWVERLVEVPQVHVIEKTVEVPQIQEVVRQVAVKQCVEVPREVIRRVPKIETKIVEREVEVPGEIIEVPKPYLVENKVIVPRYSTEEVPTVVSQRLIPFVCESETEFVDVDLKEYNPVLVPVDVYVPRPVARQLIAESKFEEHRVVDIPVGQFNTLIKQLNLHIQEADYRDLFVKDTRGMVSLMSPKQSIVAPINDEWKEFHSKGALHFAETASTGAANVGVMKTGVMSTGIVNTGIVNSSSTTSGLTYMSSPSKYVPSSTTTTTTTTASRGGPMMSTQQYFSSMPTTTSYTSNQSYPTKTISHNTTSPYTTQYNYNTSNQSRSIAQNLTVPTFHQNYAMGGQSYPTNPYTSHSTASTGVAEIDHNTPVVA